MGGYAPKSGAAVASRTQFFKVFNHETGWSYSEFCESVSVDRNYCAKDMNAIALVVGNSNYSFESPSFVLKNPVNDARGVADALTRLGFFVKLYLDEDEQGFRQHLHDFSTELSKYDNCLVYFAGHAIQIEGANYLAAIDTSFVDESSARYTSIQLDWVLDYLRKCSCKVKIVILDACRNNPFAARGFNDLGLAPVKAPTGTLIAFSTSPGERASDVGFGNNSIYTGALLKHIAHENIPIEEMFKRVRITVYSLSNKKQISWEHTSLIGDFYFNSGQLIHSVDLPYGEEYVADGRYEGSGTDFDDIISGMKSYTWGVQKVSIQALRKLDKTSLGPNEKFLIGRNILQVANGGEFSASDIMDDLDRYLQSWADGDENHVLNGILFEMYFNSEGRFRGDRLKTSYLDAVCKLEDNQKYKSSFDFIHKQLTPFRDNLYYIPYSNPKSVPVEYTIIEVEEGVIGKTKKRQVLQKIMVKGKTVYEYNGNDMEMMLTSISKEDFPEHLSSFLSIPAMRLSIITNVDVPESFRIPYYM